MADNHPDKADELFPYPGQRKSRVWKYFYFRKREGIVGPPTKAHLDMSKAICRLCMKEYAFKGNTTNFIFHLEHVHAETTSGSAVTTGTEHVKNKITSHFHAGPITQELTAGKQREIDDAFRKLMVVKVLPLSLVENEHFQRFVNLLNPMYKIPGRKSLVHKLEEKKEAMEEVIKKELSNVQDIAITHDGWTSVNTESYSTVTGHFITKEWELRSVVLETKKVEGSHTGENIKACLLETQQKWGLPNPTGVTDNAANEQKAFELLNWTRFGCYGHRINLVVKNSLQIQELGKIIAKGRKMVTFFHQSTSVNDLLMAKQTLLMPDAKRHKLIMDVPTRWNSTHDMLARLVEQTPAVMAVITDTGLSQKAATTLKCNAYSFEECSTVQRIVDLLHPFLKATKSVCGDQSPSMHKVIPIVRKLLSVSEEKENDPHSIKSMKHRIRQEIIKRTQDKDVALMACVLNPFTKDLEFLSCEEKTTTHGNLMTAALQSQLKTIAVKQEPTEGPTTSTASTSTLPSLPSSEPMEKTQTAPEEPIVPVPDKRRKYDNSDMDDWLDDVVFVGSTQMEASDTISAEVARYLSAIVPADEENISILDWWKRNEKFYPHLAILAKKYLSIPASSVPSERVFSLAGHIVNKKRSRLNPKMVDTLIFLNKNEKCYW